jgi:hypothetical protein
MEEKEREGELLYDTNIKMLCIERKMKVDEGRGTVWPNLIENVS